jgi:hypothetical protein
MLFYAEIFIEDWVQYVPITSHKEASAAIMHLGLQYVTD